MKLSSEDAQLFYELWFPILDYVNKTFKVVPSLGDIRFGNSYDPETILKISNVFWNNKGIIDD